MRSKSNGRAMTRAAVLAALGIQFTVLLGPVAGTARADGAPDGECDIQVDVRMSVYMVMVEGEPYRDKRYLTWDDAIKLRKVLVSAGACERASGPKPCKLELAAAGDYVVLRDGVNFDPYAKLRTLDAARKYARRLEKAKLCKPMR